MYSRHVCARTGVLATADGSRTAAVVCAPNHCQKIRPRSNRVRPGPGSHDHLWDPGRLIEFLDIGSAPVSNNLVCLVCWRPP